MKTKTALAAVVLGALGVLGTVCAAEALTPRSAGVHERSGLQHRVLSAAPGDHPAHGGRRWLPRGPRRVDFEQRIHSIAASGELPATFSCSRSATDQAAITVMESRIDARLSWGETAEQRAAADGATDRARWIALRIAAADQLKTDLGTVSGLITAQCG